MASFWKQALIALGLMAAATTEAKNLRGNQNQGVIPGNDQGGNLPFPAYDKYGHLVNAENAVADNENNENTQIPADMARQVEIANFANEAVGKMSDVEVEVEEEQTGSLMARRLRTFSRFLNELPVRCRNMFALIDRSGSQQSLFLESRAALGQIAAGLFSSSQQGALIGVYSFSVYGQTNVAASNNLQTIINGINSINFSGGGTRMATGLTRIRDSLNAGIPEGIGLVIPIISDFRVEDEALVRSLIAEIKNISPLIQIMCLGVTSDDGLNPGLMQAIASTNELTGQQYIRQYPNTQAFSSDIVGVFTEICGAPVTTAVPSGAPIQRTTGEPTTLQPTNQPVAAPTDEATTVPSTAPTKKEEEPIIPPWVPPIIAAALASCCCACAWTLCCRSEKEQLEIPGDNTVVPPIEPEPVAANPIFAGIKRELQQPGKLEITKPAMPNKMRQKSEGPSLRGGKLLYEEMGPDGKLRVTGSSMFTSFHTTKKDKDSKWADIDAGLKREAEKAEKEEEKQEEPPRAVTPVPEPVSKPTVMVEQVKVKMGLITPAIQAIDYSGWSLPKTRYALTWLEVDITRPLNYVKKKAKAAKNYLTGSKSEEAPSAAEPPKPTVITAAKTASKLPAPPPGLTGARKPASPPPGLGKPPRRPGE